jgi:hypothetical protein
VRVVFLRHRWWIGFLLAKAFEAPENDGILGNWPAPSVEVAVSAANDLGFAGGTPAATVMPEGAKIRGQTQRLFGQRAEESFAAPRPPLLACCAILLP